MSIISNLNSVSLTIALDSQPDLNNVQERQSTIPSTGIANTTDGFESADPLKTGIFTLPSTPPVPPVMVNGGVTAFNSDGISHAAEESWR